MSRFDFTHWGKNPLCIQKFQWFWYFKILILWKLLVQKCEFCENWDFKIVNFVTNETSEMWILSKMKFSKCEFCKNYYVQNMNFWINPDFCPSVMCKFFLPMPLECWILFCCNCLVAKILGSSSCSKGIWTISWSLVIMVFLQLESEK